MCTFDILKGDIGIGVYLGILRMTAVINNYDRGTQELGVRGRVSFGGPRNKKKEREGK